MCVRRRPNPNPDPNQANCAAIELAGAAQAAKLQTEGDRASAIWRSPDARRPPPKSPWQDLQRHEIPQQKWTTEESRLLAHLVTQHTDAKGHPMWIRIAPLLNGRTPQVCCSGRCSSGCSHAHMRGCNPKF